MRPTNKSKVLAVAKDTFGVRSFDFQSLVLACWRSFPNDFGLKEYPQYPDSRKVAVCLMGRSGLVARGLLQQWDHNKKYQVI